MQMITLGASGIRTSRLGMGCASLLRLPHAAARQRVLDAAFDAGIRHFDVARMYGLGAAEAELGRFSQGRRDQLVIATKFGLEPAAGARAFAPVQAIARLAFNRVPGLRRWVRRRAVGLPAPPRNFSAAAAAASLETSLRELRTDYVDFLFLHEPSPERVDDENLLRFLERAKADGKIRAYGSAAYFRDAQAMNLAKPEFTAALQFDSDLLSAHRQNFTPRPDQVLLTFSPLGGVIARLQALPAQRLRALQQAHGIDLAPERLAPLLLAHAAQANAGGVVVFSTLHAERIAALTNAALDPAAPIAGLEALAAELRAASPA